MKYPITYSVVIPVYNSTDSLIELATRIKKVFEEEVKATFELIMVDDCSPNARSWEVMKDLAKEYPEITVLQLMRNFGKPGAIYCAFGEVRGEYVITMDDDLQHLPEDIPTLIAQKDNHDVVIGYFPKKEHSVFKRSASRLKGWLDHKLIGKPAHIMNSPYKLIHISVIRALLNIRTAYPFISALIFFTTHRIVNVQVRHDKRKYGETGYTLRKMIRQFSNLIINNSSALLKWIAYIGVLMSAISLMLILFFIARKIVIGEVIAGWTSLITVILFTSGLMLFSVGIVGEYLIRIINGIENKPAFIVRHKYRAGGEVETT